MTAQAAPSRGGLSFAAILGIVFVVLKLTGNIAWSWIWVLSPFWIPWAIVVAILVIGLLLAGFIHLTKN